MVLPRNGGGVGIVVVMCGDVIEWWRFGVLIEYVVVGGMVVRAAWVST